MIIRLSNSIAKLIGTVWFSEAAVVKQLFDETVEVVADQWGQSIEKRNAERFFDQCADQILSNSVEYLKIEFKKVSDDRATILIDDISVAFSNFKVDRAFSESNFSEQYLTTKVYESLKHVDKKSELEVDFCRNVIRRISFYVCQYVHLAPNFVPVSVKQILENQTEIMTLLESVLKHAEPLARFEGSLDDSGASYLRDVKNSLKFIQVFGLSTHSVRKKYLLESSYISLSITEEDPEDFESGLKADDFISRGHRLLIYGAAGSGKTTLLQWTALQCCEAEEKSAIPVLSGLLPVFIRLRSIEEFHSGLSVLEAAKKSNANPFLNIKDDWFAEKASTGKVVFLIDGLDEVPTESRASAIRWIDRLCDWADECRVVVTTRPVSSEIDFLTGFQEAHLENMSHEDITRFVSYWHRAVASGLVDEEMAQALDAAKQRLLSAFSAIGSLRALATNPLMCAVLCTLNLDRNCNIPREKGEIYKAAIELLLERRDKERSIGSSVVTKIDPLTLRVVLQETARWLTINERPEITKKRFRGILAEKVPHLEEEQLNALQRFFIERTGLLRDVSVKNIDFIHKQFQEYLAAESFVQEDDIGLLEQNITSDTWREIFPLACGLMNKSQVSQFVGSMLNSAKLRIGKPRRSLLFQAVLCTQFSRRVEWEIEQEIQNVQREIFPPENVEEVYQLLPLGDKLVPLVQEIQGKESSDGTIALVVKALIETGGVEELPLIASFSGSAGENTVEQLISGWSHFDTDEYGRLVVSELKKPYAIAWQGKNRIGGLVFAFHATEITLDECLGGCDLRYLPETDVCKQLFISNDRYLSDISELKRLSSLEELFLYACDEVTDLSAVCSCGELTALSIEHCQRVEEISPVGCLSKLESLSFNGCFDIEDISAISKLKELKRLDLSGCYAIRDWKPLDGLQKLTHLRCAEEGALGGMSDEFWSRVDINGEWDAG